jgi:hypothetical protein
MASASYFLEDRSQPLVNQNPASLNDRLLTQHIDVPEDDQSFHANATRRIAHFVGGCFTPKQLLAILRVLKAVTLSFIVLTILANAMYITFVELFASAEVQEIAGGGRDTLIRLYGLGLSFIALAIEIDYTKIVKRYSGLKAFVPRALLYLFISIITHSHPTDTTDQSQSQYNAYTDDAANGDDANGDDANGDDANGDDATNYNYSTYDVGQDVPSSAVGFMMVASFVL